MASIVLGGLGSMFGGPIGGMVGGLLGSFIDQQIFNHRQKLPWIDRQVTAATYGLPIPVVYGRVKLAGNLIVSTPLNRGLQHGANSKGKGGKGSGSTANQYFVDCAVAICQGPINNIWRIYADQKLIWDMEPNHATTFVGGLMVTAGGATINGSIGKGGGKNGNISNTSNSFGSASFYYGTEDQLVDPDLDGIVTAQLGAGLCPAFRGLAYVVFKDVNLSNFGNRVPNFSFEVNGYYSGPTMTFPYPDGGAPVNNLIGATFYDSIQQAIHDFQDDDYRIYDAQNGVLLQSSKYSEVLNGIVPSAWAHDMHNGSMGLDGTVYNPISVDHVATNANHVLPAITTNVIVTKQTKYDGVTGFWLTDNAGLYPLAGAGFCYYCGSSQVLAVFDSATTNFHTYDTRSDPPILSYENQLPSGIFSHATGAAWSEAGTLLGVIDGHSQRLYNIAINPTTGLVNPGLAWCDLTGLPDMVPGHKLYILYDLAHDIWLIWNDLGIWSIASPIVSVSGDPPTLLHHMQWTALGAAMIGDPRFMLNQFPHGTLALLCSDQTVKFLNTGDFSISTQVMSYAPASPQPTVWALYNPYGEGGLDYAASSDGQHGIAIYHPSTGPTNLAFIVQDILQREGIGGGQLDVTQLVPIPVLGFPILQEGAGRNAIEALQEIFLFDLIDTGTQLVARLRTTQASATVATIDTRDLGARPETAEPSAAPVARVKETIKQDYDLPSMLTIKYHSSSPDYYVTNFSHQLATQQVRRNRLATTQHSNHSVSTAVVLDDSFAVGVAEQALFYAYVSRTTVELSLPINYIGLETGDNIFLTWVNSRGLTVQHQVRVEQADIGADNTLKITGTTSNPYTYTGFRTTEKQVLYEVPQSVPQPTLLRLLELPPLRDQDDDIGFYWGACGIGDSKDWSMSLVRSVDGGESFTTIGATGLPVAAGTCMSALGSVGSPVPGEWDAINRVKVKLRAGTLEGVSAPRVWSYQNIALVGNEIIGFSTATLNPDKSYTLSGLIRGLQGTDQYIAGHAAVEKFTLLGQNGSINTRSSPTSDLYNNNLYAGVTSGADPAHSDIQRLALQGVRIKPLSPAHASVVRDVAGDATITWTPRRRVGIELIDSTELGVDEAVEDYQVDVLSSAGNVLTTLTNWTKVLGTIGSVTGADTGQRQITFTAAAQEAAGLLAEGIGGHWGVSGTNMTLSLDALTATSTGEAGVISDVGSSVGKFYFEITPHGLTNNNTGAGLANSTFNLNTGAGGSGSVYSIAIGGTYLNGSFVGASGISGGQAFGVAVDLGTKRLWVRTSPTSPWNGLGGADPVAGVGGIDISTLALPLYPLFFAVSAGGGEAATLNAGGSAFGGAVPAGYQQGWPGTQSPVMTATVYQMSNRIGRGFPRSVTG